MFVMHLIQHVSELARVIFSLVLVYYICEWLQVNHYSSSLGF